MAVQKIKTYHPLSQRGQKRLYTIIWDFHKQSTMRNKEISCLISEVVSSSKQKIPQ